MSFFSVKMKREAKSMWEYEGERKICCLKRECVPVWISCCDMNWCKSPQSSSEVRLTYWTNPPPPKTHTHRAPSHNALQGAISGQKMSRHSERQGADRKRCEWRVDTVAIRSEFKQRELSQFNPLMRPGLEVYAVRKINLQPTNYY